MTYPWPDMCDVILRQVPCQPCLFRTGMERVWSVVNLLLIASKRLVICLPFDHEAMIGGRVVLAIASNRRLRPGLEPGMTT
jgi:hypothetical protein